MEQGRFPLDMAAIARWAAEQRRRRDEYSASVSSYRTAAVSQGVRTTEPVVAGPAAVGPAAPELEGTDNVALPVLVNFLFIYIGHLILDPDPTSI